MIARPRLAPRGYPRRLRAVVIAATVSLAAAMTGLSSSHLASAAPVAIPSPVSGGWQLNGTAQVIPAPSPPTAAAPPNLQLTPAINWKVGSAFWPTAVPGVGVTAAFDIFLGSSTSGSGADGMTFTLADASVTQPTALGKNAGGEGFSGITGIAVSFDTWKNKNDPSNSFVGIATTNSRQQSLNYVTTNSPILGLRNTIHHVVVSTNATGVSVTMDGIQVLAYATALPSKVLVGFTAATGGFNDIHQVQNVNITTGPPPPAPTVTNVSPVSGPTKGGTSVTITGTALTGASSVKFGSVAATGVTVNSDTSVTATAPAGQAGAVDVTVITPGGTSAANGNDLYTYTPPPAPTVTNVSPVSGPTKGGTSVTITGTALTGASSVKFGSVAATGVAVNSDTSVTATAPAGQAGAVDVTVITPGGTSAANGNDLYTYTPPPAPTVTNVSPVSGPTKGGTSVTITGTALTGASSVKFGSVAATGVAVNSDTSVTATAPAGQAGVVDVTVTAPGGTSAVNGNDLYTYTPPPTPTVTNVSPVSGPTTGGTSVTITGTALTGASSVKFGSVAATGVTVNSDTSVTATAPAGQAGAVDVTVITPGGTSTVNANDLYTYTPPPTPTVIIVAPNSGPAGTSVAVSGTNFSGVTEVDFGAGNKASFTVNNSTTLTAAAPPGTGTVDVTVTTAGGTTKTLTDDQFTYTAGPPPGMIPSPTAGGWQLNGVAQIVTPASPPNLQLTPATNWLVGSAFWPTPVSGAGITASFDVFLGSSTSGSGADGMTFTLADASVTQPTALGNNAGGEGFSGITGIAVSFDTWKNTNDPSNSFVGIATTNSRQQSLNYVTTNSSIPALRNTIHHVVVTTDANGISVTMDGTEVLAYTATLPSKVLVGFTAATGGFNDIHQVQNVNITTGPPPPAPTVTNVSPVSGPTTGGTSVTITGTALTGASSVKFGSAAATGVTVNSDTSVTATAPAGQAGAVDVTVTTPGGTSAANANDQYTYTPPPTPTVTNVSPGSGPSTGGTSVTITGTGFTGATAVDFGSGNPATFSVTNSTTITATAPSTGSLGVIDVAVTTPGGTSAPSAADQYNYVAPSPPTVTAVSPPAGPNFTSVTITGTNLSGATIVDFGPGNPATFSVTSPTEIAATAPSSGSLGAVDVTVTTPGGTSVTTAADQFTYQAGALPVTMVATYRADLGRSGYYPSETGVTAANVATLKQHWVTTTGGTGSYAQPMVANNLLYWGDWNGVEHATDLTGKDVWTVTTGQNIDNNCSPPVAGISGTATIGKLGSTSVDYFPGGDDNFYAVNALTGAVMWKTNLGTPPADYLWGSPILFNGSIYQPVASFGDCPLVNGRLVQMDAGTGAIQHTAFMEKSGCTGAGIWSSPAVDASDGSIYVSTGTPTGCTPNEMAPAIVKLRASDLTVLSSWSVPKSAQVFGDADFGATPTLFTATINGVARSLVGALNKNGIFYAWDRSNLAAGPVWQSTVADPSGSPRSIASAAWDGTRLYVGAGGTTLNGTTFYGNISALDPATGAFLWRTGIPGFMSAGITVVPGVLIEPYGAGGNLLFLDPATGNQIRLFGISQRADGEATVSNGIVYVSRDDGNLISIGQ